MYSVITVCVVLEIPSRVEEFPYAVLQSSGWLPSQADCDTVYLKGWFVVLVTCKNFSRYIIICILYMSYV